MESNNQQSSFWQFSDQLRLHTSLSLNDSIWSVNPYATKRPEDRRNFDIRVGGDIGISELKHQNNTTPVNNNNNTNNINLNDGWKVGSGQGNMGINLNGGFNKGIYSKPSNHQYLNNFDLGVKGSKNFAYKGVEEQGIVGKAGRKNKEVKRENNSSNSKDKNGENKSGVDKRFKTLPPAEALPKNETVGGYIFVCNNDTMEENLKRQLFGLPPRYRDSVRQITPGLPLFLYNYSTHQLHGIYEAASFGGTNIDPTAWEDKKNPCESRFPAQVRVQTRKLCEPLDEDAFRPILHHYDGPKFRLELSVPEALSLLDIFAESNA